LSPNQSDDKDDGSSSSSVTEGEEKGKEEKHKGLLSSQNNVKNMTSL
jgi:hypothetical protein